MGVLTQALMKLSTLHLGFAGWGWDLGDVRWTKCHSAWTTPFPNFPAWAWCCTRYLGSFAAAAGPSPPFGHCAAWVLEQMNSGHPAWNGHMSAWRSCSPWQGLAGATGFISACSMVLLCPGTLPRPSSCYWPGGASGALACWLLISHMHGQLFNE